MHGTNKPEGDLIKINGTPIGDRSADWSLVMGLFIQKTLLCCQISPVVFRAFFWLFVANDDI